MPEQQIAPISRQIWDMKYRLKDADGTPVDRTLDDSWDRIARALAAPEADPDAWVPRFRAALEDFRFLPAGRIVAGAGTDRRVTLFNCFVMGTIPDDMAGIFDNLKEAALTMQQGGGIGYDFSTLRPRGAPVRGVGADASGPLTFMDVWDAMCRTIMSAGHRRGAMMAVGTRSFDEDRFRRFAEAIDELASSVDMKVVFLWRTDLVKRALSEIQHRMTAASKEAPVAPEVARIAQDCRNQLTCFSWLQALFSGHSCIKFSYEELVSDQKAVLNEICGFLGVEKDRIMLSEKPRGSGVTETAPSRGIVQRLRDLAGVKGLPSEPGRSPYPLVSNAASLLKADALREYRDVLPWKQG